MAILFKQSKKREGIFVWTMIITVISAMFLISLFIFPPLSNSKYLQEEIFGQYNVKIDLSILNVEEVQNLELFSGEVKTNFTYVAKDSKGKQVKDTILALDKNEAMAILEGQGLTVLSIDEYYSTKNDPFSPY